MIMPQKDQWFVQHHSVYVQIAANTTQANVEQRLRCFLKKICAAK
jgi:hypothetical protein